MNTKIDAAMEMTLLWKSQNDFHRSLEISHRTRDSHIPTADHLRFRSEERRMNRPPGGLLSERRAHIDASRDGRRRTFSRADLSYSDILDFWLHPEHSVWLRFSEERLNAALSHRVYAI